MLICHAVVKQNDFYFLNLKKSYLGHTIHYNP